MFWTLKKNHKNNNKHGRQEIVVPIKPLYPLITNAYQMKLMVPNSSTINKTFLVHIVFLSGWMCGFRATL